MPTPTTQPKPSVLDQIQSYGGTISMMAGLMNQALIHFAQAGIAQLAYFRSIMWEMSPSSYVRAYTGLEHFTQVLGKTLGVAGVVLGSISIFQGVQAMFQNGVSRKGLFSLGQAAVGVAMGANVLLGHAALLASLSNPAGWLIAGGVIGVSALWGLTHQKSSEEVALEKVNAKLTPVYWVTGPVVAAAVGTAAMVMGWNTSTRKAPIMASIPMQKYQIEQRLRQSGNRTPLATNGPTTFVEQGCQATLPSGQANPKYPACLKTSPSKVIIVTPTGVDNQGNALVKVTSFELYKNLQFVSSAKAPGGCYIPFFIYVNGRAEPNPAVINGLTNSNRLLQSVVDGRLDTQSAQSAVRVAAAANRDCVDPSSL